MLCYIFFFLQAGSSNQWKQFDRSPILIPHSNQKHHTWLADDVDYSTPIRIETLSHLTTFESGETILTDKEIKGHRINDYSCVTKFRSPNLHPLYKRKGLWVIPDSYSTVLVEKYGNLRFYTNNLDFTKDLNFYIIEFIDDGVSNVCRLLITNQEYPELKRFNISQNKQGPIYLDNQTGQFVKYSLCKRPAWTAYEHFDVDIFLDVPGTVTNLVSFVQCKNPKQIVKNEQIVTGHVKGYSDEIGELKYAMFRYRHRFNNSFFINPLDPHCQQAIATIKSVETTSQWYPLEQKRYFHSNNPDSLIESLCLARSFCNKQIMDEDEPVIDDLHFLFTETGEMPSIFVVIKKLLNTMDQLKEVIDDDVDGGKNITPREKSVFKELFEIFIDHFKSYEAQNNIKDMVRKFMEASYTLDINRALHGSQVPIAASFQEKLRL